jgi:cytoskeletal protein CcmA (bactofilin family)
MPNFRPEEKNVVYVGEGVTLTGVVHAQDVVVIDGTVEGEITCDQLIVGPGGVAQGPIAVVDADIYGKIGTEVSVKQLLVVRSTGRVEGRWGYGEIEVEKGAVLSGEAESTGFRASDQKNPRDSAPRSASPSEEKPSAQVSNERAASVASRTLRDRKKLL